MPRVRLHARTMSPSSQDHPPAPIISPNVRCFLSLLRAPKRGRSPPLGESEGVLPGPPAWSSGGSWMAIDPPSPERCSCTSLLVLCFTFHACGARGGGCSAVEWMDNA